MSIIKGTVKEIINGLSSGFIEYSSINSGSNDVFFSPATEYHDINFSDLKVGQKVSFQLIETERGLFASKVYRA